MPNQIASKAIAHRKMSSPVFSSSFLPPNNQTAGHPTSHLNSHSNHLSNNHPNNHSRHHSTSSLHNHSHKHSNNQSNSQSNDEPLRFKVLRHLTKGSINQTINQTIELNTEQSTITVTESNDHTIKRVHNLSINQSINQSINHYSVKTIKCIEKCCCDKDNNRAVIVVEQSHNQSSDVPQLSIDATDSFDQSNDQSNNQTTVDTVIDCSFIDQTTRDVFCELIASMNRNVVIQNGCGGTTPSNVQTTNQTIGQTISQLIDRSKSNSPTASPRFPSNNPAFDVPNDSPTFQLTSPSGVGNNQTNNQTINDRTINQAIDPSLWVNDSHVSKCQRCYQSFSLSVRKHHCRRCGGVFCWSCSDCTAVLEPSSIPNNQTINQSIDDQPTVRINRSNSQSSNQSESDSPSNDQTINQSNSQSNLVSNSPRLQSTNPSNNRSSIFGDFTQSINQTINQSINQSKKSKPVRVCQTCFDLVKEARIRGLTINQSNNQTTNQSFTQANDQSPVHRSLSANQAYQSVNPANNSKPSNNPTVIGHHSPAILNQPNRSLHGSSSSPSIYSINQSNNQTNNQTSTQASGQANGQTSKQPDDKKYDIYGFLIKSENTARQSNSQSSNQSINQSIHLQKQRKRFAQFLTNNPGLLNHSINQSNNQTLNQSSISSNQANNQSIKSPDLRRLIRRGIPPELRGAFWLSLSGASNRRDRAPPGYYQTLIKRIEKADRLKAEIKAQKDKEKEAEKQSNPTKSTTDSPKSSQPVSETIDPTVKIEQPEKFQYEHEIEKDLHRTFPDNMIFQSMEGRAMLRRVLLAYSIHDQSICGVNQSNNQATSPSNSQQPNNQDKQSINQTMIGYCQSMNFLAGVCLLFMEEESAFWLIDCIVRDLTSIEVELEEQSIKQSDDQTINQTIKVHHTMYYYASDLAGVHVDQLVMQDLIAEKLPRVSQHLNKLANDQANGPSNGQSNNQSNNPPAESMNPLGPLTINWFLCLFVNVLPFETSLCLLDCLFDEGIKSLFRCCLLVLKLNERAILSCTSINQFYSKSRQFFQIVIQPQFNPIDFPRMMFDPMWLGAFPMSRINEFRQKHAGKILQQLTQQQSERDSYGITAVNENDANAVTGGWTQLIVDDYAQ